MPEVNLTKRVKTSEGRRFYPVAFGNNGRLKVDTVVIDGKEARYPTGLFYIEWREKGKRRRESVGTDPSTALARQKRKKAELTAAEAGIDFIPEDNSRDERKANLKAVVADYLEEIRISKKPATYAAYSTALEYFQESCEKFWLDDIDRNDLLKYTEFLRVKKGQSPRSCRNKFGSVITFLKAQDIQKIVKRGDWPVYVQEEPEVYEQEDLDALHKVCTPEERLWWQFFLMTGMREQEVMFCCWKNINFKQETVSVTWKPEFNWTPKAYKEREIPIPVELIDALGEWKKQADKNCALIFGTSGCRPNLHFLQFLKACVRRAGLEEGNFWLHKFRATFATWHLWNGTDLATVQSWLGQVDMASTMRYLKPARHPGMKAKVNSAFKPR